MVLQYTSRYDYEHAHSNGISKYNINVNFAAVSKLYNSRSLMLFVSTFDDVSKYNVKCINRVRIRMNRFFDSVLLLSVL